MLFYTQQTGRRN